MAETVSGCAHGKINLHLSVTERRPDGYHSIVSLFQQISLHDTIQIRSLKNDDVYIVGNDAVPLRNDLMRTAALLVKERYGIRNGVDIRIDKRIPMGAGLAGGSSDAAFVLRGLNLLWDLRFGEPILSELAAEIGSDVPFFLRAAAAMVTGRGEIVKPIKARTTYWILLVNPGFSVSTADAFRWLDQSGSFASTDAGEIESRYASGKPEDWRFTNSFTTLLADRSAAIRSIIEMLDGSGSLLTSVTGSGSTVFGVFTERSPMESAHAFVAQEYWSEIVSPLARIPSIVLQ